VALQYTLAVETGRRYLDAEKDVKAAAKAFVVDHPVWYFESAWFARVPTAVKLGPTIFLVSAVGTSLLANTENRRFAAPLVPSG
jgi:hypothetical protein